MNDGKRKEVGKDGEGGTPPAANPVMGAGGPAGSLEGMMANGSFMVQNMLLMQGISHFFAGFVMLKVPFGLSKGFKAMFQRGVMITDLETSYVSSVSWYFLLMYGLRGLFKLNMGMPSQDELYNNQLQQEMGSSLMAPPAFDAKAAAKGEAENIDIAKYRGVISGSEKRLLGNKYPKGKTAGKNVSKRGGRNRGDDIFGDAMKKGK